MLHKAAIYTRNITSNAPAVNTINRQCFHIYVYTLLDHEHDNTCQYTNICDQICENVHYSHNYNYLEIPLKAMYLRNALCIFYTIL